MWYEKIKCVCYSKITFQLFITHTHFLQVCGVFCGSEASCAALLITIGFRHDINWNLFMRVSSLLINMQRFMKTKHEQNLKKS